MNNSFGGDFNATQTASGSGGTALEQRSEGVATVLIKQLHDGVETSFSMLGMNFGVVCFAAIVRSIEPSSTKITYLLEDHTGRIEGHYWLENGDDGEKMSPDIMINNYAKVFGCLRSQGGSKTLIIFGLVNIKSTHILEVLNARFKAEENSKQSSAYFGTGYTESLIASGLDPKHRMIYEAILQNKTDVGISRNELFKKFNELSEHEVNVVLQLLATEGIIYNGYDPHHFLSTE